MAFMKRIFLFVAVNALVMITISLLLNLLGVKPYITAYGIDYESLMAFCLVWGMGGAFISLLMSKFMAKMMMGVKVIDPQTHDQTLQELVQTVHNLARSAKLPKMPEVGIYESDEVNAFATGPTKSRSLVAVSTGLLHKMDKQSIEGVLGHEIAHIANGDMVTMTLVQGVVNAFVMFLARALAFVLANAGRGDREESDRGGGMNYFMYHMIVFVLEMVFMVLGTIVIAWFSRIREFRADKGGATLAGRESMIAALQSLKRVYEAPHGHPDDKAAPSLATLKISTRNRTGFLHLFSTHPSLDERIERLELMTSI